MERKYGLDMQLPEGKLPGFYAQIVKGIAERAPLFDRHKELLIFDSPEAYPTVAEFLAHYKVSADPCELLLLPVTGIDRTSRFGDCGFTSREGHHYLDLGLAAGFRITAARPDAEPAPALLQLEEHLIASVTEDDRTWSFIDPQLTELAERIASAYRCGIEWLDTASL